MMDLFIGQQVVDDDRRAGPLRPFGAGVPQALEIDHGFRDPGETRVVRETCPFAAARAFQVDHRNLPVGRRWTGR
jgi:hypothetical protein